MLLIMHSHATPQQIVSLCWTAQIGYKDAEANGTVKRNWSWAVDLRAGYTDSEDVIYL
jgi:hypothetical protein